jgi:hypothetical protein
MVNLHCLFKRPAIDKGGLRAGALTTEKRLGLFPEAIPRRNTLHPLSFCRGRNSPTASSCPRIARGSSGGSRSYCGAEVVVPSCSTQQIRAGLQGAPRIAPDAAWPSSVFAPGTLLPIPKVAAPMTPPTMAAPPTPAPRSFPVSAL